MVEDPLIGRFKRLALKMASKYGVKILSIVLYGSRAYGYHRLRSDYDFFVLLDDGISLFQFTQFSGELRLMAGKLDRFDRIKIYVNTLKAFKRIMRENPLLGAFCYVICTMGISIYDPHRVYRKLKAEMENLSLREKMVYIKNCLMASRKLGSEKWVKHWKDQLKTLKKAAGEESKT
jgi:predicted nucleotidyltransferase